ncbi:flagellin [Haloarcula sp. S1CR25-12]|uniref:Flagellin n=1 Tax=Haloarcula saliterrae TaxID=2950534 RepID=A0ABU2FIJ9_9EURY|nr:flagellin [Haloarcula sp. S1CR25-12]MDS0261576.1 flagellin [Haloarcula sp. S1CR25-12]
MGFSVSGSAALIFVAAFIGFGMFYSATANSIETVNDAREDRADRSLDRTNTEIRMTNVSYNATPQYVNVTVENTGTTELSVRDVDVLFDNSYQTGYRTAVEGDTATDLWLPGETLAINATVSARPNRVKLVTGPGVAATEVV